MRRQAFKQAGAAALEFAIILPVLLLVLIGTIEWGRYFVIREAVVHAAREGARGGTLLDATEADACAAATAFLYSAGIAGACGSEIIIDMDHPILSGGETIAGVEVRIDLTFPGLSAIPVGLPQRIVAIAVMPQ